MLVVKKKEKKPDLKFEFKVGHELELGFFMCRRTTFGVESRLLVIRILKTSNLKVWSKNGPKLELNFLMCCPITLGPESNLTMPTTKKKEKNPSLGSSCTIVNGFIIPIKVVQLLNF
jgi:hypothetical protein